MLLCLHHCLSGVWQQPILLFRAELGCVLMLMTCVTCKAMNNLWGNPGHTSLITHMHKWCDAFTVCVILPSSSAYVDAKANMDEA